MAYRKQRKHGARIDGWITDMWSSAPRTPKKWTYEKLLQAYSGAGIPKLCFALIADVFEHKRLCKPGTYNKALGGRKPAKRGCSACAENLEWIMRDDPMYVFSFTECCHRVGLEPSLVRRNYLNRQKRGEEDGCSDTSILLIAA